MLIFCLNLFPHILPFEKEEPPVSFHKFIVPSGNNFRFPAALLSIHTSLGNKHKQLPQLDISFGNFKAIENKQFVFDAKKKPSLLSLH